MLKVGMDISQLAHRGGVAIYTKNLAEQLSKMDELEMEFFYSSLRQPYHGTLRNVKKYKLPHEKTKRIAYLAHFEKEIRFSKTLKKLATKVRAIAIRFPIP